VFRYVGGRRDWFAAGRAMRGARARQARAGDVARRDVPTCRLEDRLRDVSARVRSSGSDACIVVNAAGVVLGRLGRAAWTAGDRTAIEEVMDTPTTYRPDVSLTTLEEIMRKKRRTDVPITDAEGVLLGVVLRDDAQRWPAALGKAGRGRRRRVRPRRPARGR
jgi:CBS domain-containing protein